MREITIGDFADKLVKVGYRDDEVEGFCDALEDGNTLNVFWDYDVLDIKVDGIMNCQMCDELIGFWNTETAYDYDDDSWGFIDPIQDQFDHIDRVEIGGKY